MRVIKLTEAEITCEGTSFDRGCGSRLAVTAADVTKGTKTEYDCDGDPCHRSWRYITCPVCGAKTEVNADLSER